MQRPKRLTDAFVERVTTAGRFGDGRGSYGLSLLVKTYKDGGGLSKSWAQRLYIDHKAINRGLGSYPAVTLDMAREQAILNARAAKGVTAASVFATPILNQAPVLSVQPSMPTPAFKVLVDDTIIHLTPTWKNAERNERNWRSKLGKHALPHIGDTPIAEITPADVSAFVLPLWNTMRPTAIQLVGNLNMIFKHGIARGYITANPMDIVQIGLSGNAPKVKHQKSIPYQELGAAIEAFNAYPTNDTNRDLFLLLALTGVRFSQARLAKWREIDFERGIWTCPPENVKAKITHTRPHVIPLSQQAISLLRARAAQASTNPNTYIFAQPKNGKLISERLTLYVLQRAWPDDYTVHGLRSTLSVWAQEETRYDGALVKAVIDHVDGSEADRAYLRSDYLDKRRSLMQDWADFLVPEFQQLLSDVECEA